MVRTKMAETLKEAVTFIEQVRAACLLCVTTNQSTYTDVDSLRIHMSPRLSH